MRDSAGFMFVLALLALFVFLNEDVPVTERDDVTVKSIKAPATPVAEEKMREITISYNIQLDSVYTGAVTYIPCKGSKVLKVRELDVATSGLPIMHWIDQCVILDFERANGEPCRLFFKTLGKHDNQQGFIPAATDGVIRFQKNLNQILFVSVRVERRGENNFAVFVTPLGAESMTGKI